MNLLKKWSVVPGVVLCALVGVIANVYVAKGSFARESLNGSQDVRTLDRRISTLEQRLYFIETSINRIEQSVISQRPQVSQSSTRDQEAALLRAEIQTLQARLNEIECGLVKLDERTTTPAVREARREAAKIADPCRLNPATPLRLSTRP